MKKFELYRERSKDDGTKGELYLGDDMVCNMLELPWRDNKTDISCIPPGRYEVKYLKQSASGKYKDVYYVVDAMASVSQIVSRDGILIHKGNWAGDESLGYRTDSDGCLLPCFGFAKVNAQTFGQHSGDALQAIHDATGRQDFILDIYGV